MYEYLCICLLEKHIFDENDTQIASINRLKKSIQGVYKKFHYHSIKMPRVFQFDLLSYQFKGSQKE